MAKTRAHIFVSGLVQGVFFRHRTKQLADSLNVKGWVKNLHDGRVEAVFEGEEDSVRKLVDFCKTGPRGAYVTNIDVLFENFKNEFLALRKEPESVLYRRYTQLIHRAVS